MTKETILKKIEILSSLNNDLVRIKVANDIKIHTERFAELWGLLKPKKRPN